jgi:HSP20 family protein
MTTVVEPFPAWLRDINRFFTSEGAGGTIPQFIPPADVLVGEEGVMVYMDVPGLRAQDLEIELENDVLSVHGERPFPYRTEGGQQQAVRRVERGFGRFERSLRVPRGLDPGAVEASLSDGVLSLRIPKPESLKPHRIEIKAGEGGTQTPEIQSGRSGAQSPGMPSQSPSQPSTTA